MKFRQSLKLRYPGAAERVQALQADGRNVAKHLWRSGRCAITHVKDKDTDPDNPEDHARLIKDLPIVEDLARYAIESGLLTTDVR